jgi:hypothetical protein
VVDTVGTFVEDYFRPDRDVLINPLDYRSLPWNFLNECSPYNEKDGNDALNDSLIKNVAECLIDSGARNDYDNFWDKAAKIVFVETAKKAIKEKKSTQEFLDFLLKIPLEDMQKYLKDSYAHSLVDSKADKMALSIRATLINAVSVFDIIKESKKDNFSIREWIASGKTGILFLSCKPMERASMIPIITSWLSIASESLLHSLPTEKRTWFFIDELHNLRRLPKIETSLAEIRKFGGCFVIGTQMISQLNNIYGREVSKTLTGLCGTKIVMCIPEPETAKYMSGFLGEKEEISASEAISYGANTMRDGVNIAQKIEKKQTVPYSEIMKLKPGEAFIGFSGVSTVTKTTFKLHKTAKKEKIEQLLNNNTKIISINDYLASAKYSTNDLLFYGIPLNDEIISRPIYFFDEDLSQVSDFLRMAREKNKKVVVFEDNSKLYDKCFRCDPDILLNHQHENGYNWDMIGEYQENFLELANAIIKLVDFSNGEAGGIEQYLFKMFSNIEGFEYISTADLLNKIIFKPLTEVASDLDGALGNFEKYSYIREKLSMYLHFLKPNKNIKLAISMRKYLNNHNNGILFLSNFNNANSEKFSNLIIDSHHPNNTLCLFSSKKTFKEIDHSIIDGKEAKTRPASKSSVICSLNNLHMEQLLTVFDPTMSEEKSDLSYFVKIYKNSSIVSVPKYE